MKKSERQEIRWSLDWLTALALLFCGLFFLMPPSLRVHVMEPAYAQTGSVWPLYPVSAACFYALFSVSVLRLMGKPECE